MGRTSGCTAEGLRKGFWTEEEDQKLLSYIKRHGEKGWCTLPQKAGLQRCGKSCRLRWVNYLRPGIKRGEFTPQEEQTIIRLHASLGNKWSAIAREFPRRTDNEIKNYWNTRLRRRLEQDQQEEGLSNSVSTSSLSPSTSSITTNKETPQPEIGSEVSTIRPVSSTAKLLNKLANKKALINLPSLIGRGGHGGAGESTSNSSIGLENNVPISTACGEDQMEIWPQDGFLEEISKALDNDVCDQNVLTSLSNGHFDDRLEFYSMMEMDGM
ncbi:hypothetical protein UlMin_008299 [Ulmus minor]